MDLPVAPGAAGATRTERSAGPAAQASANPRAAHERALLVRIVEQTLDAMEPMVVRILRDEAVSAEHALHIVVMDPTRDRQAAFGDAILLERSFGDPAQWRDFTSLWLTWWMGDGFGALIFSPLILSWSSSRRINSEDMPEIASLL